MNTRERDIELLKAYTAERMADDSKLERDMRSCLYLFDFLLMTGPNQEEQFTGCSFSQRGMNTLLVVKKVSDSIPYVAFVTERTPMGCIATFGRVHLEGRIKWHLDKFART